MRISYQSKHLGILQISYYYFLQGPSLILAKKNYAVRIDIEL